MYYIQPFRASTITRTQFSTDPETVTQQIRDEVFKVFSWRKIVYFWFILLMILPQKMLMLRLVQSPNKQFISESFELSVVDGLIAFSVILFLIYLATFIYAAFIIIKMLCYHREVLLSLSIRERIWAVTMMVYSGVMVFAGLGHNLFTYAGSTVMIYHGVGLIYVFLIVLLHMKIPPCGRT